MSELTNPVCPEAGPAFLTHILHAVALYVGKPATDVAQAKSETADWGLNEKKLSMRLLAPTLELFSTVE
ncbi:hypothetical protein YDYSY3_44810 [Paenibacillus chitinolyticus]|uniref:hypothetical protein n=1 Tax=Paenibacillus chitinolyticus TaxID=79263 RepID=UPI0026E4D801|nr:hypothetical protein [Paenibacillus chitinolyticus]GKS13481.1 hypothetical protein YDYSY3_44810 [Paenibacillus chitinolyticus]